MTLDNEELKLIFQRGYVAVNVRRNIFVLDNTTSGFDLHQLDNGAFIRTFRAMISGRRVPKQVAFLEDAEVVVGGSDHGVIYIFDRRAGKLLDMLRHAEKGLLQTIAVSGPLRLHSDETIDLERDTRRRHRADDCSCVIRHEW